MQKLQIDANTWATLNLLLDEALDQPAEARAAWIERLAPEFSGLKPRLQALLLRAGANRVRRCAEYIAEARTRAG